MGVAILSSILFMVALNDGCETYKASAAFEKLPSFSIVRT